MKPFSFRSLATLSVTLVVMLSTTACFNDMSDEEAQEAFSREVNALNNCKDDSECSSISVGCPLPCSVAVNINNATKLKNKANELIGKTEKDGSSCDYGCAPSGKPICVESKCTFDEKVY